MFWHASMSSMAFQPKTTFKCKILQNTDGFLSEKNMI